MIIQAFGLYNMSITKRIGNHFLFIFPFVTTELPCIICQEPSPNKVLKQLPIDTRLA